MSRSLAPVAALGALACFVPAAAAPGDGGPVTYWVSATTRTGMDTSGGRPSPAAMMSMMTAGGGGRAQTQRSLLLQLGSNRPLTGAPDAAHQPPATMKAGSTLPLLPRPGVASVTGGPLDKVKGKLTIYWGCGDKAAHGQPLVIDLSKPTAAGAMPQGFPGMQAPSNERFRRYVDWPNRTTRNGGQVTGPLAGEHLVNGPGLPEIKFNLAPTQDFMAPLILSTVKTPSGATRLTWVPVAGAKAYFAAVITGSDNDNLVMWTSSAAGPMPGLVPDYLAQDEIGRQLGRRALLAPTATECVVPREVTGDTPGAVVNVGAYGAEANFSYPPRPANAKAWSPDWVVKVRYRAAAGTILGLEEDGEGGEAGVPTGKKGLGRELLNGLLPFPG